jgi:hypothetical protein
MQALPRLHASLTTSDPGDPEMASKTVAPVGPQGALPEHMDHSCEISIRIASTKAILDMIATLTGTSGHLSESELDHHYTNDSGLRGILDSDDLAI